MNGSATNNGSALKQMGLYQTEANNTALVGLARAVAKEICGRLGYVDIDMVRNHPAMAGFEPTSPNVWGAIWHEPGWHCIDRKCSDRASNHHREIKVWAYRQREGG